MSKTTAPAARYAINESGHRVQLPQSWPTADQIQVMGFGLVFADLQKVCKNILTAGNSITFADRCRAWERIEEAFLGANGSTWQDMVEELREMLANVPVNQPKYENCLDPISPEDVATLERIHEAGKFRYVSKETYSQLFKGAASSRRAGVHWTVWSRRAIKDGHARGLVALIAFRAYSMPTAAILKVGA